MSFFVPCGLEKSSSDILPNIFFCVPLKKVSHMRVRKWPNFHFSSLCLSLSMHSYISARGFSSECHVKAPSLFLPPALISINQFSYFSPCKSCQLPIISDYSHLGRGRGHGVKSCILIHRVPSQCSLLKQTEHIHFSQFKYDEWMPWFSFRLLE